MTYHMPYDRPYAMWYAIVRAGIEHGQVLFHAEYCFYVKIIEKIIQNSDRAAPDHPVTGAIILNSGILMQISVIV